jgi:hypothetical protein
MVICGILRSVHASLSAYAQSAHNYTHTTNSTSFRFLPVRLRVLRGVVKVATCSAHRAANASLLPMGCSIGLRKTTPSVGVMEEAVE